MPVKGYMWCKLLMPRISGISPEGGKVDIYRIHPYMVRPYRKGSKRDVEHQMRRLQQEGQIEPIVVKSPKMGQYEVDRDHPDYFYYSPELVEAAIWLEWDEILVTY